MAVLLTYPGDAAFQKACAYPARREPGGYAELLVPEAKAGMLYRYRLDNGCFPDPCSRFQPQGPHGPSQLIDPESFTWTDGAWAGLTRDGQVIYEMHIGTFTEEGTWQAAMHELPALAELGVTVLEVMPVADFAGEFGWGYDGVNLFAPTRLYGQPDDFRAFVNRAHTLGLGVILDVVYNHLGPDGNYLKEFSPDYLSTRHVTEWGQAMNFDGRNSGPVRELFIANAAYWAREFHLDGLRLDATQQIFDDSPTHILAEVVQAFREAASPRQAYIVAENEPQQSRLARPAGQQGYGLDALWNDDFHHSARAALTGQTEAYYLDYCGKPQEFVSAAKYGFLYQGTWYSWQGKRRGDSALDLQHSQFVDFLENHDQVANSLRGLRLHQLASPGQLRALTALLLLGPSTPMLFQGQEFASAAPFQYFAHHRPDLMRLVSKGRKEFLFQFPSVAADECGPYFPDPGAPETFARCKLSGKQRRETQAYRLHRDLLRVRREMGLRQDETVDGAVLGTDAFLIRFMSPEGRDRLLLVNLGTGFALKPQPEPLLAPPAESRWELHWSSEHPGYGGVGTPEMTFAADWRLPGRCALMVRAVPARKRDRGPEPPRANRESALIEKRKRRPRATAGDTGKRRENP